jgi:hypothetical protein
MIYKKPTYYTGNNGYLKTFLSSSTTNGALITVNYTAEVDNIDDIIATKAPNSNVVKGSLITTS